MAIHGPGDGIAGGADHDEIKKRPRIDSEGAYLALP